MNKDWLFFDDENAIFRDERDNSAATDIFSKGTVNKGERSQTRKPKQGLCLLPSDLFDLAPEYFHPRMRAEERVLQRKILAKVSGPNLFARLNYPFFDQWLLKLTFVSFLETSKVRAEE